MSRSEASLPLPQDPHSKTCPVTSATIAR